MEAFMQPFLLRPAFKDYLWGGRRLKTDFGKETDLSPLAESWELSAHPDGEATIATGAWAGRGFAAFVEQHPESCGSRYRAEEGFPILIKLIDAKDSLSVQVHPDDKYALRVEGENGKTEMWVILDCEPGAFLYYGFEHSVDKDEFRRRIEDNTLTEILHKRQVKPGDSVFIPAGTIHAIGAGIVLAEIQQNSNSTYRVYDFGRRGADGKLRPLHIEKALDVTTLAPAGAPAPGAAAPVPASRRRGDESTLEALAAFSLFRVTRLELASLYIGYVTGESFHCLLCTRGGAVFSQAGTGADELKLEKGSCLFIPAGYGAYTLEGGGEFLITSI